MGDVVTEAVEHGHVVVAELRRLGLLQAQHVGPGAFDETFDARQSRA